MEWMRRVLTRLGVPGQQPPAVRSAAPQPQGQGAGAGGADAWVARGNAALAQGDACEAERCYRCAVVADPAHPLARLNLGYVLLEQDPAAAEEAFQQALTLQRAGDDFLADAHFLLARARRLQGDGEAALANLVRAVRSRGDFVPALQEAVDLLQALGRPADAVEWAGRWSQADPSPAALLALAQALYQAGRAAEALGPVDAVLAAQPGHGAALEARATVLMEMGRPAEALAVYESLGAASVPSAQGWSNRAAALHRCGRLEEALEATGQALVLEPGHRDALYNRGRVLMDLLRLDEAERTLSQALATHAGDADLRWNRAVVRLLRGNFADGWADYEARWDAAAAGASQANRTMVGTRWTGREDLRGRSIAVLPEQGLGDNIQFARYLPLLRKRGARVIFPAPAALKALLADSLPGVAVVAQGAALPAAEYEVPLLDLPQAFGTSLADIPCSVPYLRADAQALSAWQQRLGRPDRLRVGIVWSGSTGHRNDANRSIALSVFRALAVDGVDFVSLQKEVRAGDEDALAAWPQLRHFGDQLGTLGDTAALVDSLDVVVSVDTSVAHLAGAMGRPVWILLPQVPDWRWMLERADSPWYPTARLYRQSHAGAWAPVLARVRDDLAKLARGRAACALTPPA